MNTIKPSEASSTEKDKITIVDLFAGVGGLSYGISQANDAFEIIAGIDYEEDAIKTFNDNHPNDVGIHRDLAEYSPDEFSSEFDITPSDVDVIVGGPPCKGFSEIRPNKDTDQRDDRNYLYRFYFDFVQYFEPEVFVMENVPSLLKHTNEDGNRIFNSVMERAQGHNDEQKYTVEYAILNAAQFGVPQSRTRLFVVGSKSDTEIKFPQPEFKLPTEFNVHHRDKILTLPENETLTGDIDTARSELEDPRPVEVVIKDLPPLCPGEENNNYFCDLDRFQSEDYNPSSENFEDEQTLEYLQYLRDDDTELTWHETSGNSDEMRKRITFAGKTRDDIFEYVFPSSGYDSTYSRLYQGLPAPTLTTTFTGASSTRCIHPYENRTLSVREGARIQSFPDAFDFIGSRTSVTTQIGNAVPPLLAQKVGNTVLYLIEST